MSIFIMVMKSLLLLTLFSSFILCSMGNSLLNGTPVVYFGKNRYFKILTAEDVQQRPPVLTAKIDLFRKILFARLISDTFH